MKLSHREIEYLYSKKLKEGFSPSQAYAQIKKDLEYQKKIKKKKKINADDEKDTIKNFKKEFAKLTRHHES